MLKITLGVDGMMCGMCESHVNDAVRKAFPVECGCIVLVVNDYEICVVGSKYLLSLASLICLANSL